MHFWQTGLLARISPSSRGEANAESGNPTTEPPASIGSSTSRTFMPSLRCRAVGLSSTVSVWRCFPVVSNFSNPKPIGSTSRWQLAQEGSLVCSSTRTSRVVIGRAPAGGGGNDALTPGGGGGTS